VLVGAMKDLQGLQAALEAFQQVGGAAFGLHASTRQAGDVITCVSFQESCRLWSCCHTVHC
jgi:hypothetical protein